MVRESRRRAHDFARKELAPLMMRSCFKDLTRTVQENFLATTTKPFPPPPMKDTFAWNYFLQKEVGDGDAHAVGRRAYYSPSRARETNLSVTRSSLNRV